jgi:hypothetical protein
MEIKLLIFLFIIGFTAYCSQVEEEPVVAPKTTIEIEPGESVKLIIVEPQEEAIERTLVWDKKARKYLRKEKKEDVE